MKARLGEVAREALESVKGDKRGLPAVGLEHLISEELTFDRWSTGENTFTKTFKRGQMLFGRRRAYLKKAAIAPFDGICSGDITVIEAKPDRLIPELLPFIIQNDSFFDFAVSKSAGSLSPRVKWAHLKEYEFNLPSMEEQRKLAELLWAAVRAKSAYKELLLATDELIKSQFVEMFGNGKNFSQKQGVELFEFASGKFNPTSQLNNEFQYPCYGGNGITGLSKEYLVEYSTIVIGRVGANCGCVHITKPYSWITDNAIYLKSIKREYDLIFLYYHFTSMNIRAFADGAGQPKISQKPLYDYFYPLPPLPLQNEFAEFVRQADKSKFTLQQTIKELDATHKAIIKENLG